jgi:hypothetical protein
MTKTSPEKASELQERTKTKDEHFLTSKLTWATTLLRLMLIFEVLLPADLSEWLGSAVARSVLVNPVTTFVHVKEAVAIRQLNTAPTFASAYVGQRVHLPPLLLAAAESTLYWIIPYVSVAVLLLIVDFQIALWLESMARRVLLVQDGADAREVRLMKQMNPKILPEMAHIFPTGLKDSLLDLNDLPLLIAQLYYCNPITVLAGSGMSMGACFQNLRLLFLMGALATSYSAGGSVIMTSFSLAAATYLDIHCAIFLVPVALIMGNKNRSSVTVVALFGLFSVALQALSMMLTGSDDYLSVVISTHLYTFQLRGLAPSLTTIWYFGMELFQRFQVYFEFLLAGVPYLIVVPTTIRLYQYPAVLVSNKQEADCYCCLLDMLYSQCFPMHLRWPYFGSLVYSFGRLERCTILTLVFV